jgi:hypothetical protein
MTIFRLTALFALIALTGCGGVDQALYGNDVKRIVVNDLTWKVAPINDRRNTFAVGLNDGFYPSGVRFAQKKVALKALESVTGCSVIEDTVTQIGPTGVVFVAEVSCGN